MKMKNSICITFGVLVFCSSISFAQLDKLKKTVGDKIESVKTSSSGELSEKEVGDVLKEALTKGIEKGVT